MSRQRVLSRYDAAVLRVMRATGHPSPQRAGFLLSWDIDKEHEECPGPNDPIWTRQAEKIERDAKAHPERYRGGS